MASNKLPLHTPDKTGRNFADLAALFPNAVTETIVGYEPVLDENGKQVIGLDGHPKERAIVERAIDKDVLAQEINAHVIEGKEERYQFTWPDKKKSVLLANAPIAATLRPCRKESVNFDTTENLYIEGDNLDVLKLLQETYLNRVKMIYIDPPYNTGNDFVYSDDFDEYESNEAFYKHDGQFDEDGNRMVRNLDSNGRFHTDWLNMIYPRLRLARDLLTDDGAIFISIDDNEVENLKKICNVVFGGDNAVATIVWKRKRGRDNSARWFSKAHEYLLVYAKRINNFNTNFLELDEETKSAYKNPDNDPRGIWRMLACWARGTQGGVKYDFTTKNGQYFSERLWLFSKKNLEQFDAEDKLVIRGDNIYRKMFIDENKGKIPETLWDSVSNAANAADEIKRLFDEVIVFETPKPIPYILEMLKISTSKDSLILDFFSGSATTAHAVIQLNAEDGGKRKFIMVQLPEVCDPDSEAAKAGYKNICEIGKERIRRAGDKILELSLESLEKKGVIEKNERELSEANSLAKVNGLGNGSISALQENAADGNFQFAGSNEASGGLNPKQYSGRTSAGGKGVYSVPKNSTGVKGGIGNTIIDMRTSEILGRHGYRISTDIIGGDKQNDDIADQKTRLSELSSKLSLDIGFRVLKLDSTNMKDVYYTPQEIVQRDFDGLVDNIKSDRTPEDLLFQVMLDLGVPLSAKIEKRGKVFYVNDNYLVACFEPVDEALVAEIAQAKPYYAVFRDSSFKNDSTLVNFEQLFKTYSPTTIRKVL